MAKGDSDPIKQTSSLAVALTWQCAMVYALYSFLTTAYRIRLLAIETFGPVIHEFDPYFNYRATEYLDEHGAEKFFTWFDYKSWYPLGRPVGTTIYPGMQFTAVFIKNMLNGKMSLNDVCVYIPAWFGVLSSFLVGCMAYECSISRNTGSTAVSYMMDILKQKKSTPAVVSGEQKIPGVFSPAVECGILATGLMAVVPAHLMRSIGGGFDNESIAVTAMSLTFYLWVRSLRENEKYNYLFGVLAGFAYYYMAAAWGGYVFVLNLIGVHAGMLVLMGRFTTNIYLSYTLFYVIGTSLAIQIPVIGMTPLRSLEQMGPCLVFFGYQILQITEMTIAKKKLKKKEAWKFRVQFFGTVLVAGFVVLWIILPKGYYQPISSRVRGLFVKHTKTGNPLVDSVAEHQPASNQAYFRYLQHLCTWAPLGFIVVLCNFGDASSFLVIYALMAFYFSNKMVRLVLLLGPICSILGGISAGRLLAWSFTQLFTEDEKKKPSKKQKVPTVVEGKKKETKKSKSSKRNAAKDSASGNPFSEVSESVEVILKSKEGVLAKQTVAFLSIAVLYLFAASFNQMSWMTAKALSHPSIIFEGRTNDGKAVLVDDYRDAYRWLKDNTPEDARVLAWWDYGYQISAIANRTTIADGNTWNHEHIGLLGRVLTSNVEDGYNIARHLADYVLIWGGGGGDDLAKSPHLARIANSVFRHMCPGDPTCRAFGFMDNQLNPSRMMRESFLYNLHSDGLRPGVEADPEKFKEVFRSKYMKVRIFKLLNPDLESKAWVANPKNRICDIEGGWYCKGQYPPGLQGILSERIDFSQLEDFNREKKGEDDEYQRQYFENLNNPKKAKRKAMNAEKDYLPSSSEPVIGAGKPTQEQIDSVYQNWADTEQATLMWKLINEGQVDEVQKWIESEPLVAYIRSSDGRGPMWWAFESRKQSIVRVLMSAGLGHNDVDKYGKTPVDLLDNEN